MVAIPRSYSLSDLPQPLTGVEKLENSRNRVPCRIPSRTLMGGAGC